MEQNSLCNFGRGHYEEHFCEIIFEYLPGDVLFKYFSIFSSGSHFVQSCTICAILVEGFMVNICVK